MLQTLFSNSGILQASGEFDIEKTFTLQIGEREVPVRIVVEHRYNSRVTIDKKGVFIRISRLLSREEQKLQADRFLKWAKTKLGERPQLLDELPQRQYMNGEQLRVGEHEFRVNIFYHNQTRSTGRILRNQLVLNISRGLKPDAEANTKSYLVSRCLAKYFQPIVAARLHELNKMFFRQNISAVRLKYNTGNWGSCSSSGNINISVRLMFAPQPVIDYVLVHELAHLIHPNHSPSFWRIVETVMPEYKLHEQHLKENHFKYFL